LTFLIMQEDNMKLEQGKAEVCKICYLTSFL
jgi:hypothetical protein